ncbi:MAG: tetratricopeptide repeat protein, partial [Acidobacteria bacterium]|nr:tetratricopeptide repeat protein [Acidobacteriota bacterium]
MLEQPLRGLTILLTLLLGSAPAGAQEVRTAPAEQSSQAYERLVEEGQRAEKSGRLDEALSKFQAALKLRPRSAALQTKIGGLHYNRREYAQALEHFEKALVMNPMDFYAAKFSGIAALRLNRSEMAIRLLEKAQSL